MMPVNHRQLVQNTIESVNHGRKSKIDGSIDFVIDGSRSKGRPSKIRPFDLPMPLEDSEEVLFSEATMKAVGKAIRKARQDRILTMKMVFESAGLDRTYYGLLELGKVSVSVVNLAKIARTLGMSLNQLMSTIEA